MNSHCRIAFVILFLAAAGVQAADLRELDRQARAQYSEGHFVQALQTWEKIDSGENLSADHSLKSVSQYNRAGCLYELKRYDEAIDAYQQALPLLSNQAQQTSCRYNLGNTYVRLAEKQAQDDLKAAIESLRLAGRYYREALQDNPDDVDCRRNLAVARQRLGQLIELQKKSEQLQQQQQQEQKSLADQIKELLQRQQQLQQQTAILGEQLSNDPNNIVSAGSLGQEAQRQGQLQTDTTALEGQVHKQLTQFAQKTAVLFKQGQTQTVPPDLQKSMQTLKTVSNELTGSAEDQTTAVSALQDRIVSDAFAGQARSTEHLKKALDALKENQQQQGQSQQNQQGSDSSQKQQQQQNSKQGQQSAGNSQQQQEQRDPSQQNQQGQNGQQAQSQPAAEAQDKPVDPSEQMALQILQDEKEQREQHLMRIRRQARSNVEKDW